MFSSLKWNLKGSQYWVAMCSLENTVFYVCVLLAMHTELPLTGPKLKRQLIGQNDLMTWAQSPRPRKARHNTVDACNPSASCWVMEAEASGLDSLPDASKERFFLNRSGKGKVDTLRLNSDLHTVAIGVEIQEHIHILIYSTYHTHIIIIIMI